MANKKDEAKPKTLRASTKTTKAETAKGVKKTAAKKADSPSVADNKEYLASFPELNHDQILEVTADGTIVYLNPACKALWPDLPEAGLRHPFFQDWPQTLAELKKTAAGQPLVKDVRVGKSFYEQTYIRLAGNRLRIYCRNIDRRKKAENDLRLAEENLRKSFETSPLGIRIIGRDGKNLYGNNAVLRMFGYDSMADFDSIPKEQRYTPESFAALNARREKRLRGERIPEWYETTIIRKDGTQRYLQIYRNEVLWEGQLQEESLYLDITARKKAEQALHASVNTLKRSYENSPLGIRIVNKAGKNIYANPALLAMFGYSSVDDFEAPAVQRYTPESFKEFQNRNEKRLRGEFVPNGYQIGVTSTDGAIRYLQVFHNEVIWEGQLHDERLYEDITERVQAEQGLLRSEFQYSTLVEQSTDGILILKDRIIDFANHRIEELSGYTPEEVQGKQFYQLFAPEYQAVLDNGYAYRKAHPGKTPADYTMEILHKDGRRIPVETRAHRISYRDEFSVMVIIRDISERKEADKALQISEKNFRNSLENSPLGIRIVSAEGETLYMNKAILDIYGFDSIEEFKATPVSKRYTPDSYLEFHQRREKRWRGERIPDTYEISIVRKDGAIRHLQVMRKEVLWDGKKQYQTLYLDITLQHQMLNQINELNTILKLITDINQLIVKINNEPELLQKACEQFIESGQYNLAWIGFKQAGTYDITPFAQAGAGVSYLSTVKITWDDSEFGQGPTGVTIRTGKLNVMRDILHDPRFVPWRDEAVKRGFKSTVAVPLVIQNEVIGGFMLYSPAPDAFNENELELLQELAGDLSLGIEKIRQRERQARSELELRRERDKAQTYLDVAGVMMVAMNIDGKVTLINRRGCEILGYEAADIIGKDWFNIYVPEDRRDESIDFFHLVVSGKVEASRQYENQVITASGAERTIYWDSVELRDEKGNISGILSSGEDITERKTTEQALKDSEEKYSTLIEQSTDGIIILIDRITRFANHKMCEMSGYPQDEIIGKHFNDFVTSEYWPMLDDEYHRRMNGENVPGEHELELQNENGRRIPVETKVQPIMFRGQSAAMVIIRDITERKTAEIAAKNSEQNFRNSMDGSLLGIRISDEFNHTLYANQALLNLFGYKTIQDIEDSPPSERYTPESQIGFQQRQLQLKNGEPLPDSVELDIIRLDGSTRHVQTFYKNVLWDGKYRYQTLYNDITERKQAEEALKESENRYRSLFENMSSGFSYNRMIFKRGRAVDYTFIAVNPAFEKQTGLINAAGKNVTALVPGIFESDHELFERYGRVALTQQTDRFELFVKSLGKWFSISVYSPQKEYFVTVFDDITERKQAEEALKASEQNFRNSLDNSSLGILIVDENWNALYTNQVFLDIFGYADIEEVRKKRPSEFYTPEEHIKHMLRDERELRGEGVEPQLEVDIIRKDGVIRHIQTFRKEVLWNGKKQYQLIYNDLTERKQAEEALKASEQNFRNSLDSSLIGVRIVDQSWRTLYANQVFLDTYGYKNMDDIGIVDPKELYTPAEYQRYLDRQAKRKRGEPVSEQNVEQEIIRRDGAIRYVQTARSEVLWNGQQQFQVLGIDVTERKLAEKALQVSEENFRNSIDGSLIGVRIVDENWKTLYANKQFLTIWGCSTINEIDEMDAAGLQSIYTPAEYTRYLEREAKRKQGETVSDTLELEIVRKDHSVRNVLTSRKEIIWNGKKEYQILYNDITERIQAEKALKASEQNFRNTLENSPMGVRVVDAQWHTLYANKVYLSQLGYDTYEEIDSLKPTQLYTEAEYARYLVRREKAGRGFPEPSEIEQDIVRKDGAVRHVQVSRTEVLWDGKTQYLVLQNDITEQKHAQEAQKVSEENFRNSLDNSPLGIRITDIEDQTLYLNQAFLNIFGYESMAEVLISPPLGLYSPASYADYMRRTEKRLSGASLTDRVEIEIKRKDGTARFVEIFPREVFWNGKQQFQTLYNDITERKKIEEALTLSEQNFRNSLDSSSIGIRISGPNEPTLYANQTLLDIFGYKDMAELVANPPYERYTPISYAEYLDRHAKMLRGEKMPEQVESEIIRKDGTIRNLVISMKDVFWDGKLRHQTFYTDITELKITEAALKASEKNFHNSLDSSPMGMYVCDNNWHIFYVNQAFLDMFGYQNIEEVRASPPHLHYTPEEKVRYQKRIETLTSGGSNPDILEIDIIRKDGKIRHLQIFRKHVLWDGNQQTLLLYTDITERKQAEKALLESEAKYRVIVENSRDIIFTLNNAGNFVYASPSVTEMLGYRLGDLAGKPFMSLLHPEDVTQVQESMRRKRSTQTDYQYSDMEFRVLDKNRATHWLFVKSTITRDVNGKFISFVGIARDVTEQKRGEKQKEMSLKVLHLLNQSGPGRKVIADLLELFMQYGKYDAVSIRLREGNDYPYYETRGLTEDHVCAEKSLYVTDEQGRYVLNGLHERILKCMCGAVVCGKIDPAKPYFTEIGSFWTNSTSDFNASPDNAGLLSKTCNSCPTEGYESLALIPLHANNVTIGLLQINDKRRGRFTADVIRYFEGLAQSIGIALAQKQAEESLTASEVGYRRLFETAKDGILLINAQTGMVTDANPYLTDLLDMTQKELVGRGLWEINVFKNIVADKAKFQEFLQKGYVRYEDLPLVTADGRKISVEFVSNVYDVDQRKVIQCNIRNISERKLAEEEKQRLEEKAQVASRLAAMGEMAAGIAHEINNPLTGVLGYSQMVLSKDNVPEDIKGDIKLIAESSQRVAEIVKRLLTFARQSKPVKVLVNVNDLIDNTLKLRDYVLKTAGIKVETKFDPALPSSVADPGQLQQVFLNLIVNAEQAMKTAHGKGLLTISTEKYGNSIRMLFKDDGPGITKENMEHLFEPFFTTKALGEGTGLGLSLSRSIILEHGGKLTVESTPGQGATFIIELPILEAVPNTVKTAAPAADQQQQIKKGRILVVDDEAVVRGVLQRVLTKMGHSVDVISEAKTAMEKIDAGAVYDVILTDVRMPGMSGIEMYTRIIAKSPEMRTRVIFITGDVMGGDIKTFLTKNDLSYLAKPFDIEALKTKINNMVKNS